MKNVKRFLASVLVAVSVLAGGLTISAPAQAAPVSQTVPADVSPMDYGTYVHFASCGGASTCTNWHLRIWTMNGAHNYLFYGDTARNVLTVCPPDSEHALQYYRPNGTGPVIKAYGACQDMEWAATGTYQFGLTD